MNKNTNPFLLAKYTKSMEFYYTTGLATMNKKLLSLLGVILIGIFIATACVPANPDFLSGTGGGGESEEPTKKETEQNETGGGNLPPDQILPASENVEIGSSISTTNFYSPTLTIIVSNDGTNYTTGLSIPPIGLAEYQLTAPKKMQIGNEYVIELIVVSEALLIEKNKVFQEFEENVTQVVQGKIDLYPEMNAEILTGTAFHTNPQSSIKKIINESKSTTWLWYIKALQTGEHKIAINISVPILVNSKENKYPLENLEFVVYVENQPSLLPTAPTPTKNPITGTGFKVTIEAITAVVILLTTIITGSLGIRAGINKYNENKRRRRTYSRGKEIGAKSYKNTDKKNQRQ